MSTTDQVSNAAASLTLRIRLAVGETVILLQSPLPLAGVSIVMGRGCQQNDRTLADGWASRTTFGGA